MTMKGDPLLSREQQRELGADVTPAEQQQEARLIGTDGQAAASIQVTRFPDQPAIIIWQGRYFIDPVLGFGPFLSYREVSKVYVVPEADASDA